MDGNGTDLIELKGKEKNVKKNKQTKETQTNLRSKYICIVSTVILIIIIWILVLSPPILVFIKITKFNISTTMQGLTETRINTLPTQLPSINNNNITNYTILSIQCENRFVFESKESICYPPCYWNPTNTNLALFTKILFLSISTVGLVMSTGTLIGWLVASYRDYRKRNSWDFQLARASLFMVVLSNLGIFVTNTIIDSLGRAQLLCERNGKGELYLLAHIFEQATGPGSRRTLTNIIGGVFYFFLTSTFYWIIVAFANILFVIFLPLRVHESVKRERTVFCVQIAIGLFVSLLLIGIVVAINPETPFVGNYQLQQIYVSAPLVFLIMFILILSVNAGAVLTLALIALTKLRLVSLRAKSLTGHNTHLTELEKRLLVYAFVYSITYILLSINLGVFVFLERSYLDIITEYVICVNVNSEVTLSSMNTTQLAYRDNTIGNLTRCDALLETANRTLPIWVSVNVSVVMRVVWMIIFIILIPRCTPKCLIRKVNKQTSNKQSGVRNATH